MVSKLIKQGTIVKGVGGFYNVDTGDMLYEECKARGVFKKREQKPYVGDLVDLDVPEHTGDVEDTPVITKIHDRRNCFQRPPVSNVEQFVVVTALADPQPNIAIVDRFLVNAEVRDVDIVMCFTKKDLVSETEREAILSIYRPVYPVVAINGEEEHGADPLIPFLKGRNSALAGPSGAGKSTILRALRKDLSIEVGNVSDKTGRGKHTTRHVELFSLEFGGQIFDTPGFTSFDTPDIPETELPYYFPEIAAFTGSCRFHGCRHLSEPDCAVRNALQEGKITESRYRSYCRQIEEIREKERRKY